MYRAARPERRAAVGGLLLSLALTSFLTGVTEPIEFTFMFLAPALYAVHAVLTGVAMALMHALGIRLGFGFSAGLFDYVLNFSRATRALWLLPIGLAYFGIYYGLFRYGISRFGLATPGREADGAAAAPAALVEGGRAGEFIAALGGAANLVVVEACMTRLRLTVGDSAKVDDGALARLGARGVIRPAAGSVQVVLGPVADQVAGEIRQALKLPAPAAAPVAVVTGAGSDGAPLATEPLLAALGGRANLASAATGAGRLLLRLKDPAQLDSEHLRALGVRGIAAPEGGLTHLLLGSSAAPTHAALLALGVAAG
jgi:PTS system N-acetylglucosamine-specific IIC component